MKKKNINQLKYLFHCINFYAFAKLAYSKISDKKKRKAKIGFITMNEISLNYYMDKYIKNNNSLNKEDMEGFIDVYDFSNGLYEKDFMNLIKGKQFHLQFDYSPKRQKGDFKMKKTLFDNNDLKDFENCISNFNSQFKDKSADDLHSIWDDSFIPNIQDYIKIKKNSKIRDFFFNQDKIPKEDALILLKDKFKEIEDYFFKDKTVLADVLMLYSISLGSIFIKKKEKKVDKIWKTLSKGFNKSKKFKIKFLPKKFRKYLKNENAKR